MNSKIANGVLVKYCLNRWEGTSAIANIESEHVTDLDHTFTIVEQMPEFPGGEQFLISYIQSNFRYPKLMRERKVMGTVYLTFVVQYDGKIADIRILKGIPGGKELDEMAVQLVQNMPRWKPGKQNTKPVNVQFNLPIKCELKKIH